MAFFDEIGKKITKTGQDVMQKTKDTAETLRLGGLVSDEEKRINAWMTQLGNAYFTLHASDPEPQLEALIASIRESQEKIAEYNEQIKKLKGVAVCPQCGREVAHGATFCSSCGASLQQSAQEQPASEQTQQSAEPICPKCGAKLPPDAAFCTVCGNKL